MAVTLRILLPGDRPLRCSARHNKFRSIECEREALHCKNAMHAGRNKRGGWYFW